MDHNVSKLAPAALLFLLACSDAVKPVPPRVVSETLHRPAPLVRRLDIALEDPAPVTVEYWTEGDSRLRIASPAAAEHSILLTRLRPERTYNYAVLQTSVRAEFTTSPLPDDLAAIQLEVEGSPTIPLIWLHLFAGEGFHGYAVVNGAGEVVWFYRTKGFTFGATRRANGNFVILDKERGLLEITPAGSVVAELAQDTINRNMHHDAIATPWNSVLFIAHDVREVDGATVAGDAVWEWSPEVGWAVKRWSSWEHLSFAEDGGPSQGGEWLHANSLHIGRRGNILMSLHHLDQVISIAPDWSGIEWRLGGLNATIPVPAGDEFSGQHTAAEVAPGRVLLFDNGRDIRDYSRAVEFDISGETAAVVWEWRPANGNYAAAVSSARRLPSGNTLVAFGLDEQFAGSGGTEVYEVTPEGRVVWHLAVDGITVMYRAEPLSTIAGERALSP